MNAAIKYLLFMCVFIGASDAFAQKEPPQISPDDPVAHYNAGIDAYRKDDFKTAQDFFTKSLVTENKTLETKAEYNIGNSLFKSAKAREASDPEGAIDTLHQASRYYKKAMDLDAKDLDAKYNHELTQKLIKILMEKPKTEKPQNQNKDQDNKERQKKEEQDQQQNQQPQQQQPKDGQEKKEEAGGSQKEEKLSEEEARMLASQFGQENARLKPDLEQNNQQRNVLKDW